MKIIAALSALLIAAQAVAAPGEEPVLLSSPGFPASRVEPDGRLVEDWGAVGVKLTGEGVVDGSVAVKAIRLDEVIPAAQATADRGAVKLTWTAFRAPAFPSGIDVLSVRVEEARGQPAEVKLSLDVPAKARIALRTVKIGGRTVLALPSEPAEEQDLCDWGYADEATALRGWAKPEGTCDPAFRNIRAGMGGATIVYRFKVAPKSKADVVLGFCESHWAEPGRRVLIAHVEGAPEQEVDPVAKWGRHQPGVLAFVAGDENGDGMLEIVVRAAASARDRNPILNAIWLFRAGELPALDEVVSGRASAAALRYVDVGGENDQSIFPPGKLEYRLTLPAGGAKELVFFVASEGGSAPLPETTAWTAESLRRAARDVWRDWQSP
jgi:hypothetical protein